MRHWFDNLADDVQTAWLDLVEHGTGDLAELKKTLPANRASHDGKFRPENWINVFYVQWVGEPLRRSEGLIVAFRDFLWERVDQRHEG